MKLLVFGGNGKMGAAVAWDLVKDPAVELVGLVGRRRETLEKTRAWLRSPKVAVHALDVADREATTALMKQYDVGVLTLPDRRTSYLVAHTAIEAGLNCVDMLEEYHRAPDAYETEDLALPAGMALASYGEWLHQRALETGVTFMDGIGFAPGISNITVGEGIRKLDVAESAIARVGGIPSKAAAARRPLRYMITWAFWHVLREYMIKVNVRKGGEVVEVDAATEREAFRFDKLGRDEALDILKTADKISFVTIYTPLEKLRRQLLAGEIECVRKSFRNTLKDLIKAVLNFPLCRILSKKGFLKRIADRCSIKVSARHLDIKNAYEDPARVFQWYKDWFGYIESLEADVAHNVVINSGENLRIYPASEWEKIVEKIE